jgi:hypothetical protein
MGLDKRKYITSPERLQGSPENNSRAYKKIVKTWKG